MSDMKVYITVYTPQDWEDSLAIEGVFSTEEKAQAKADELDGAERLKSKFLRHYEVMEFEVQ